MLLIYIPIMALMLLVLYFDTRYYVIPNWLNLAIILLYPLLWAVEPPEPWWTGLAAMGAMFVLGLAIYALGVMGGGDVKLLSALMLWTGWGMESIQFLLLTAVAGGVLAIMAIILRRTVGLIYERSTRTTPRILMRGQPIPYGIAIASAFLMMLEMDQVP